MSNMTEYRCPSCGTSLAFEPTKGKLACPSCANEYDIETMQAFNKAEESGTSFSWDPESAGFSMETDHLEDTDVYVCQSCGAAIETDKTTAATACPYCGSNVILDSRLEGGFKPSAIIPFKITPKTLPAAVKAFTKGKMLLPGGFFSENKLGKIQGIYVPFWLFDCHIDGEMTFTATRVRTYRSGQYDCTETSYYLLERDGELAFEKIPVDASERMDNDLMDSIEPFDFSELVDFDKAYLSGYLADRYDTKPEEEMGRAELRMNNTAAEEYKKTAHLYATVTIKSNNVKVDKASVKYVLLPVYLFTCTYKKKEYRYAVNGQTGKVVGELPISAKKGLAWFGGVAAGVFAVLFTILALL